MINENEIRIGNWIMTDGNERQWNISDWVSQYNTNHVENFYPIPITKKWLEKLGFNNDDLKGLYWDKDDLWFKSNTDDSLSYRVDSFHICSIQYVHELQNLYFAITKTEL